MSTAGVDDAGNIWFLSDKDSQKKRDIALDPRVRFYYSHPGKSSFLIVSGDGEVLFVKSLIEQFWNPSDKGWFEKGKDDPSISLIKVTPDRAHFWDTRGNRMVNFLKMVASAATGRTLVEGDLQSFQFPLIVILKVFMQRSDHRSDLFQLRLIEIGKDGMFVDRNAGLADTA